MGNESRSAIYLPGLHGLRFTAAAATVVTHVEHVKFIAGLPNEFDRKPVAFLGAAAVTVFFALSGFLITYLLLVERELTSTVDVLGFYIRRALRIWPLYFAIALFALVVAPAISRSTPVQPPGVWVLFLSFLPNVAVAYCPTAPFAAHLWSIGVEEQFYAAWAPLVRAARRHLLTILAAIAIGCVGLRCAVAAAHIDRRHAELLDLTRFDCMAIGGIAAVAVRAGHSRLQRLLFAPATQITAAVALVTVLVRSEVLSSIVVHDLVALPASVLMANLACNPTPLVRLEARWTRALGDVSYGVYMFHPLLLWPLLQMMRPLWNVSRVLGDAVFYASTFACVLSVAFASHRWFEMPFLRLKRRFAVVESGTEARRSEPDAGA